MTYKRITSIQKSDSGRRSRQHKKRKPANCNLRREKAGKAALTLAKVGCLSGVLFWGSKETFGKNSLYTQGTLTVLATSMFAAAGASLASQTNIKPSKSIKVGAAAGLVAGGIGAYWLHATAEPDKNATYNIQIEPSNNNPNLHHIDLS